MACRTAAAGLALLPLALIEARRAKIAAPLGTALPNILYVGILSGAVTFTLLVIVTCH